MLQNAHIHQFKFTLLYFFNLCLFPAASLNQSESSNWWKSSVYEPNSCPLLPGAMRGCLLRSVCASPASGGQRRAGGLPPRGASGPAGHQGETAAGLRSVSGPTPGPQGPHAAYHAEGVCESEPL